MSAVAAQERQRGAVTIVVPGEPIGQGAISHNRKGQGYHSNSDKLLPWRDLVRGLALRETGRHDFYGPKRKAVTCRICRVPYGRHALFLGAVALDVEATIPRPASVSAEERPLPITRPGDWDHLGRAIGDALTGVVFVDDSQIVDGRCAKTYPRGSSFALDQPGAVIRVWEIDPHVF